METITPLTSDQMSALDKMSTSGAVQSIADGMRLCQMMVERVEPVEIVECDELPDVWSNRLGGFGSTGRE